MPISNFLDKAKKPKNKKRERVLSLVVLVVYLIVSLNVLGFVMEPVSLSMYLKHELKEISRENRTVDMVFVGASRTYASFVPSVFEETMDLDCVLNAGSGVQLMGGSYYQLRDLIDQFHPKYAVLCVTWDKLIKLEDDISLPGRLVVYDRLNGLNKLEYAYTQFEKEERLYFIPAHRYRGKVELAMSMQNVVKKYKMIKNNYIPDKTDAAYYSDSGFVYCNNSLKDGNVGIRGKSSFDQKDIDAGEEVYLEKIVDLCEKEGVKLYLATGPTTLMTMYSIENYQDATNYYTEFAKKHGLVYHNLNLIKNREALIPDSKMKDYNHINGEGAMIISEKYANILLEDIQGRDTSSYFYSNFDELKKSVNRVVAVKASIERSGEKLQFNMESLQSDHVVPYYKAEISTNEGKTYKELVPWTKETAFEVGISVSEPYQIRVKAKTDYENEIEAYQVYKFD